MEETSRAAVRQASRLMDLRETYRQRLSRKPNPLRLLDELFVNPFLTAGLLTEMTGRSWGRIYLARPILEAIEDGA